MWLAETPALNEPSCLLLSVLTQPSGTDFVLCLEEWISELSACNRGKGRESERERAQKLLGRQEDQRCAQGATPLAGGGVLAGQLLYNEHHPGGFLSLGILGLFVESGVESREPQAMQVKSFRSQDRPLEAAQARDAGCPPSTQRLPIRCHQHPKTQ